MQATIASPSVSSQERGEVSHMDNHTLKNSTSKANGTDAFHDHPSNNRIVSDQGVSTQIAAIDVQSFTNHIPGATSSPYLSGEKITLVNTKHAPSYPLLHPV